MISIIMPIRDAEKYLEDCLNSILNQDFKSWELFAVNDHSTDSTSEIIKKYAQEDSRIHYVNNIGKGIIDALNSGYKLSTGNAITRMDADDIMPSNKLADMYDALQKNKDSLITGYVKYIADFELKDGYLAYEKWLNNLIDNGSHYKEIYKECVIASPCWMISRAQFEKCGAFISKTYPEDYDLCFRFYENKIPIIALKEFLHIWRDHSSRASRNDENYSDNSFLDIKLKYFLKIDFNVKIPLVLWGAGKKAKALAKVLVEKNIDFVWACNNPKKIGHEIYSKVLENSDTFFHENTEYQTIITVANKEEQQEIKSFLKSNRNISAFWFC